MRANVSDKNIQCQVHTYPDLTLRPATRQKQDQNCTQNH